MPANEDCYEPADETVFEVWERVEFCGSITYNWLHTQTSQEEAKSVLGPCEEQRLEGWAGKILSIDIYETTRRRVGGIVCEAPGEVAE